MPLIPSGVGAARAMSKVDETGGSELEGRRLRDVVDTLREGIQILSPEWRYVYVNEAAAHHGRRSRSELIGHTMHECYPGIETTPIFATLERCMHDRTAEIVENEFEYADGERSWFELRIEPCPEGLIVLSLDITERKRLEADERRGATLRTLGEIAASVAHDLANVLHPIGLQVHLLRTRVGSDHEALEALAQIERAVRIGAETLDDVRRFARHESERARTTTELDHAVDTAVAICWPRFRERSAIALCRERGEAPPISVDATGLVNAIVNLLVNALDATQRGGTISVRTGGDAEGAFVEVRDDGTGMSPEVARHIFEPFFTTKEHGTGLGLATVSRFVRRHGGRIDVDSAVGRGTSLRLHLPAAPAASATDAPSDAAAPHCTGRLLVVEDNVSSRKALVSLLTEEGFSVESAPDGIAAIARLEEFVPDLMLVDLHLPGIDGSEVARTARARNPCLPIVVVSGSAESSAALSELLGQPLTEHVVKPIDLDALVGIVRHLLVRNLPNQDDGA